MVIIDGYMIDSASLEEHTFDANVTEYPVEEGADVADHVRSLPQMVTVEGVVSDTPIGEVAENRTESVPSAEFFARLWQIREDKEPIRVETNLTVFDNMILQTLTIPIRDGDALHFKATFKELVIVTADRTKRVEIPRAAKKQNRGNKPSKEIDTNKLAKELAEKWGQGQDESWLYTATHR